MNKNLIRATLKQIGIKVNSFEFTEEGHRVDLELIDREGATDPWERLEETDIIGFEKVSPRFVEPYEQRLTLVPNCESEFVYYINKYVANFGLSRSTALIELERIVQNTYNPDAVSALESYKRSFVEKLFR